LYFALEFIPDERRRVLGVSVALSEAEVHWRAFLEGLLARGLRGVEYVVSDDHSGLRAARRAVLGGAKWQRCQFHLAQNAIHHAPNVAIRKRIGTELRAVWNASDLPKAEAALADLVETYRDSAPKLAGWLEKNVPEGLTVFALPDHHRRRLRTSNPIERAIQQELKRRTVKVSVRRAILPREGSLFPPHSPTRNHWNASSAPCWSRSTKNGPSTQRPTSNGNARMTDHAKSEFPDSRLRNRRREKGQIAHCQ
jgi:transposase-like protein